MSVLAACVTGGVAALAVGLPAHAQFSEIGIYLFIPRQADGTVWQGECGGGDTARVRPRVLGYIISWFNPIDNYFT